MHFRRFIIALALAASFCSFGLPVDAAKRAGHAAKSGSSSGPKTVHVKGYTRKDGTKVKAHDRAATKTAATKTAKPAKVKEHARTPPAVGVTRNANGRITRSASARHAFEVQTGYPRGRPGYVIDHIKPLACGGADAPSNMQWQTIGAAKAKDKIERVGC